MSLFGWMHSEKLYLIICVWLLTGYFLCAHAKRSENSMLVEKLLVMWDGCCIGNLVGEGWRETSTVAVMVLRRDGTRPVHHHW
jgi:hypothetical protein